METHAQDAIFIVWAYAGAALVVLGLIAAVWWQSRGVKARLSALEAQGIRRRSAGSPN
ncbi:MAG TPA: heme exporter protein CcmD [Devosia sp.]|jgi:heme exporter protein CcmD|nr:heme exporter protein CcmD [Devosia sp.]